MRLPCVFHTVSMRLPYDLFVSAIRRTYRTVRAFFFMWLLSKYTTSIYILYCSSNPWSVRNRCRNRVDTYSTLTVGAGGVCLPLWFQSRADPGHLPRRLWHFARFGAADYNSLRSLRLLAQGLDDAKRSSPTWTLSDRESSRSSGQWKWRRHIPVIQKVWDENPILQPTTARRTSIHSIDAKQLNSWRIKERVALGVSSWDNFREILQPRFTVNKILARDNATLWLD